MLARSARTPEAERGEQQAPGREARLLARSARTPEAERGKHGDPGRSARVPEGESDEAMMRSLVVRARWFVVVAWMCARGIPRDRPSEWWAYQLDPQPAPGAKPVALQVGPGVVWYWVVPEVRE